MIKNKLSVREVQQSDIDLIVNYWLSADDAFLTGMGVDLTKIPSREEMVTLLSAQLNQSYKEKKSYCIIWLIDGKPAGHSNVNKIQFGEEACMHLHLWKADVRQKGMGAIFVKMTLPYFFKNLHLKKLYCEPYAVNPAPNKTVEKIGFTFIREHLCIPGNFNFLQQTKLWELADTDYKKLLP